MDDIYNIGRVLNPFQWKQPPQAPVAPAASSSPQIGMEQITPYPFPAFPDLTPPPAQLPPLPFAVPPARPPLQAAANPPAPPPEPEPVRPPLRNAGERPDNVAELIRQRLLDVESSGNYQAKNSTSSASGAYQYINSTWNNYGGYPEARLAPKHVQDAKANEDIARSLRRFNGDPFRVFANHMLPSQANKPWLWTRPSQIKTRNGVVTIPPVIDYVRKAVRGTPYESQLDQYIRAHQADAPT